VFRPFAFAFLALGLASPAVAHGQTCTDPHYRWTEKTDESLASVTPTRAYITTILRSWGLLSFTSQAQYKCADRTGRELRTYSVIGWLRRIKKGESDGDWHFELTARRDSPVDSCIVAEIPPVTYSAKYDQARDDLDAFLTTTSVNSNGDLATPIRVRVIGAAFFDGEHRGGPTRRDQTDGAHGRCNSSARALWEIHPVYWVRSP
jgi:hypothetical protein